MADIANSTNNVFAQIVGQAGGFPHHHHHHGDGSGFNRDMIFSGDGNGTVAGSGGSGNSAQIMLKVLSKTSSQHRTGLMVTISFSIVAALLVLYTIVHDAYRVRPGEVYSRAQKQSSIFSTLHPAEVFPFIVGVAVLVQGFIFLAVQSTGLSDGSDSNFEVSGCTLTSQLIWPATFLVIFVILAYSIETTIRAVQTARFRPRGKFTTPVCLAAVALGLLGLWLSAHFFRSLDVCPASLSWWTVHYARIGVVIGGGVILTHLISAIIITMQLKKATDISGEERIAASRVVYTMAINIIVIALVSPFWIQIIIHQFPIQSSKVADVGITLTGLLFGVMHLFTRANAERIAIRPKDMPWAQNRKIRLFGSSDLHQRAMISAPLLEPKMSVRRPAYPAEKVPTPPELPPDYTDSLRFVPVSPRDMTAGAFERPLPPEPAQLPSTPSTHGGFTTEAHPGTPVRVSQVGGGELLPAAHYRMTTDGDYSNSIPSYYTNNSVEAPLPLFALTHQRHERQDSSYTSASIEIGLRISGSVASMEDPKRDSENALNGPDLEKSLPNTPRGSNMAESQAAAATPPAPRLQIPSTNVGIGALGKGPKGGLAAIANQPQRTSPLANVIKASTPSPTQRSNPFSPPPTTPPAKTGATASTPKSKSPQLLSPPATVGLPRSPSPRARTPSPTAPEAQRSAHVANKSAASSVYSAGTKSPTEWPSWPAGDDVDLPSPRERRWV